MKELLPKKKGGQLSGKSPEGSIPLFKKGESSPRFLSQGWNLRREEERSPLTFKERGKGRGSIVEVCRSWEKGKPELPNKSFSQLTEELWKDLPHLPLSERKKKRGKTRVAATGQ